jgi:hypothetical protein
MRRIISMDEKGRRGGPQTVEKDSELVISFIRGGDSAEPRRDAAGGDGDRSAFTANARCGIHPGSAEGFFRDGVRRHQIEVGCDRVPAPSYLPRLSDGIAKCDLGNVFHLRFVGTPEWDRLVPV